MKKEVNHILETVIYPETGESLAVSGLIESVAMSDERIAVTLTFPRNRDPFANSIKRQVTEKLEACFPEMAGKVSIYIKERPAPDPKKKAEQKSPDGTSGIKKIIAIASGKGGVGKSTVTANLGVALHGMGYQVGVLDADIYGPSQPRMFGVEGYQPGAEVEEGVEMIIPAESHGIKVMSVGFFISDDDALIWRGPMATGALKQLIHQTKWGGLDYLLIDLPPGTGDVHLTVLGEIKIDGAVVVSTPQQVAVADVRRGISMFRAEKINIPVLGMIENMAWFTPAELPDNKYFIFGKSGAEELAAKEGIDLLGRIPVILSIMEGAETGKPDAMSNKEVSGYYTQAARTVVEKLGKGC